MNRIILVMFIICICSTVSIFSQESSEISKEPSTVLKETNKIELKLDFHLFDFPYQIDTMNTAGHGFFGSYGSLSMNQSLALTVDAYSSMHFGMRKLYDSLTLDPVWKNTIYYGGSAAGILLFAYVLPFGYPWMQQEYTRSVLSRFDINSTNGAYNIFNPNGITGITDAQLGQFKTESPHDMVRMYEASSEGYILLSDHLIRNVFFYDLNNLSNWTALIATLLGGIGKNGTGLVAEYYGSDLFDNTNAERYKNDGEEESRLLSGVNSINWVYDLFRPDEPYSARGVHPSGNGIARYIYWNQLTDDEKQYLVLQGWLSLLNILSPLYYGFNEFPLAKTGFEWDLAIHHYLTSFGSDTAVQMFLKREPFNMLFTYHSYTNYVSYFPAIEGELFEFPLQITPKFGLLLSPRIMIGMQPKNQEFKTKEVEFLGLLGLRVDFAVSKHFLPFFDFSAKTNGWIAGNEYLNGNVNIKLGVSARF